MLAYILFPSNDVAMKINANTVIGTAILLSADQQTQYNHWWNRPDS